MAGASGRLVTDRARRRTGGNRTPPPGMTVAPTASCFSTSQFTDTPFGLR